MKCKKEKVGEDGKVKTPFFPFGVREGEKKNRRQNTENSLVLKKEVFWKFKVLPKIEM